MPGPHFAGKTNKNDSLRNFPGLPKQLVAFHNVGDIDDARAVRRRFYNYRVLETSYNDTEQYKTHLLHFINNNKDRKFNKYKYKVGEPSPARCPTWLGDLPSPRLLS